jgi:hypothetical protein
MSGTIGRQILACQAAKKERPVDGRHVHQRLTWINVCRALTAMLPLMPHEGSKGAYADSHDPGGG